jgi:hypothetical protein
MSTPTVHELLHHRTGQDRTGQTKVCVTYRCGDIQDKANRQAGKPVERSSYVHVWMGWDDMYVCNPNVVKPRS